MNIYFKSLLAALAFTGLAFLFLSQRKSSGLIPAFNKRPELKEYEATLWLIPDEKSTGRKIFREDEMNELISKITDRAVNLLAVPEINFEGKEKLKVHLKGITDTSALNDVFTGSSEFGIWETYYLPHVLNALNKADEIYRKEKQPAVTPAEVPQIDTSGPTDKLSTYNAKETFREINQQNQLQSLLKINPIAEGLNTSAPDFAFVKLKDTTDLFPLFRRHEVIKLLPADAVFMVGEPYESRYRKDSLMSLYVTKSYEQPENPFIDNEQIKEAFQDFNPADGRPVIQISLSNEGAKIFEQLTARTANKHLVMVIDNKVISAPMVQGKISGGNLIISGNFTIQEAKSLAILISAEKLPVPLSIAKKEIKEMNPEKSRMFLMLAICFACSFGVAYLVFHMLKPTVNK